MLQLVKAAARLLHLWWFADRIRVSPREGRLLRLQPNCILRICGEWAEVMERRVADRSSGQVVVYRCAAGAGNYELALRPIQRGVEVVLWRGDRCHLITEEDVEVFSRAPGAVCSRPSSS
jgi:hypothetical protein